MTPGRRSAFTLLELTLVLALMTLIGAIVWPALDAPFAAERLKKTADQLRADFTRGRVAAMNTGRVHLFSWDPATRRYAVVAMDDMTADPFSVPVDPAATMMLPALDRPLPEDVTIHEVAALDDVTPPPAISPVQGFGIPTTPTAAVATTHVYFHPDGTTSTARVTLANDRQMFIDVHLRGLTGGTAIGDVLSAPGVSP
jgi:type II secretory pathway pseudopilin PulG